MNDILYLKLNIERQLLEHTINEYGITHPLVLAQSKHLDELIVQYQKDRHKIS